MSLEEIRKIKESYTEALLAKPNVIGVGTGYKVKRGRDTAEPCVVALVSQKKPKAALSEAMLVPRELDGVVTDVIQVGVPFALQSRLVKVRPAPGGVSIGHYLITAGTLGCVVRSLDTNRRLILSNNHVLANLNNCQLGDAILQPGAAEGGTVDKDTIGTLERYVPLDFGTQPAQCDIANAVVDVLNWVAKLVGSSHRLEANQQNQKAVNYVDAACAKPTSDDLVLDEIMGIGVVSGTRPAMFGMTVRKSGRTSGLTTGVVNVMDATITVGYHDGKSARFDDQILTTSMSTYGDSGSLVVAGDELKAVGLLFAGSDQATILNPIQTVLDALKVTL